MTGTNLELDRDTSKKNMEPKASDGFINGKLYVGKNSKSFHRESEFKKVGKRIDYKVKTLRNALSDKSSPVFMSSSDVDGNGLKIGKKLIMFIVVILSIVASIALGNVIINRVSADDGGKLSKNSTEDPLSGYEMIVPKDAEYDSDNLNIPDPMLSNVGDSEPNGINTNPVDTGNMTSLSGNGGQDIDARDVVMNNSSDDDMLTMNDVPIESDSSVDDVSEDIVFGDNRYDELDSSGVNQPTVENNVDAGESLSFSNSEEAIYYYAKRNGEYGLVGFPLKDDIKHMDIDSKVKLLAKELLRNPEGSTLTMLPDNTKFLGFKIMNKTLYLNFSDEFNYNIYGVEGDIQQIAQVVYTFTSLEGINKVTFMIDGDYPSSIGSHGIENRDWTEEEIAALM